MESGFGAEPHLLEQLGIQPDIHIYFLFMQIKSLILKPEGLK
jgi:hypothetical protein